VSTRRTVLTAVTAWVAVVALGSALVWLVIGRVGESLDSSDGVRLAPSRPTAALEPTDPSVRHHRAPTPGRASPRSGPTASEYAESSGEATVAPGPVGSPQAAPVGPPSPAAAPESTPGGPAHATPQPSAQATEPATPTTTRRTWEGDPGVVTAECRAAAVSLVAAQPESGYAVDVEDRGPRRLVVVFEEHTGAGEAQVAVEAVCVRGRPAFSARSDDGERSTE
jgi:hypothetical protein